MKNEYYAIILPVKTSLYIKNKETTNNYQVDFKTY